MLTVMTSVHTMPYDACGSDSMLLYILYAYAIMTCVHAMVTVVYVHWHILAWHIYYNIIEIRYDRFFCSANGIMVD